MQETAPGLTVLIDHCRVCRLGQGKVLSIRVFSSNGTRVIYRDICRKPEQAQ